MRNSPKNVPKGGVPVTAKDDKSMEAALVLFLINPDTPSIDFVPDISYTFPDE